MFKVKEHVVYPLHGIGTIENIFEKDIEKAKTVFYRIKLKDTGMVVSLPIDKATGMGLRRVIHKNKIKDIINKLSDSPGEIEENWKLRFQENINKLKTGAIENIVSVVKELFVRNKIKSLSIMERKQFENAYQMLVKEISLSGDTNEEEVNSIVSNKLDTLTPPLSQ